jgi:adenylate cyclase
MATEIERRFLVDVDELRKANPLQTATYLEQGYLSLEPSVRVRIGGSKASLTIKGKGLAKRPEYPYLIPPQDATELLCLCKHKLTKIRYDVYSGGDHWEVDEFLGRLKGLWIAEIELRALEQSFERPVWLRKEVTEDPRYQNVSLVVHGLPPPGVGREA